MNVHTDKSIAEHAAEWLVKLDAATADERAEFEKWLRQSPLHVREVLLAHVLDIELRDHFRRRRLDAHRRIDVQALLRSAANVHGLKDLETAHALEGARSIARISPAPHLNETAPKPTRTHWLVAMAACFVALFAAATVAFHIASDHGIVTRAGEWQTKILDDGTIMRVGPRTKIDVDYTPDSRRVRLVHGEALFHVAKNPSRPFVVETQLASAVAIGTAFAVSLDDPRHVRVTVKEGVVAVEQAKNGRGDRKPAGGRSVTLKAGDEVVVTSAGLLATKRVNVDAALAWAKVQLSFDRDTVERVVREYNRRNEMQIKVVDPTLLQRTVTGTFDASDPESFALYLERQGAVAVIDEDTGTLMIAPYPDAVSVEAHN